MITINELIGTRENSEAAGPDWRCVSGLYGVSTFHDGRLLHGTYWRAFHFSTACV